MSDKEAQARKQLFLEVKEAYWKHNKIILFEGATGSGKTYATLRLMKEHIQKYGEKWEIIVPTTRLIDEWWSEIKKWKMLTIMKKHVEIYCYSSLHKFSAEVNVVLDEVHKLSDMRYDYIEDKVYPQSKSVIALSASVTDEVRQKLKVLGIHGLNTVVYSLDSAVSDDIVAPYKIDVIEFPLDDTTKNIPGGNKSNPFMTTEMAGYQFMDKQVRRAMSTKNDKFTKFKILERMRFIYNLPSKLTLAQKILDILPQDKKILIFCGSIRQANAICNHRYHSETDDTDYQKFCKGEILRMSAVNSIAEGVNIPELDYILLLQVQSGKVHLIQKIGRLLRKTSDPQKVGHVIILNAIGTQDNKWVVRALSSFDQSRITYVSQNQILQHKKVSNQT